MKTLIIDNYDSFTYNLYQLVGELGGQPNVVRNDAIQLTDIKQGSYSHIVISPGPGTPEDEAYFGVCTQVIRELGPNIPLLGVCLGHQGIISAYGGTIVRAQTVKHGKTSAITHTQNGIFSAVRNPLIGMRYHSLVGEPTTLPDSLIITATSEDGAIMAGQHKTYSTFGVQIHPESIGTKDGKTILKNFMETRSFI